MVQITVANHPEYGATLSRADGLFDLVVNGGEELTLLYERTNYLSAIRPLVLPVQDFVEAPDVALVALDAQGTPIDLTSGSMQVARGSVVSDSAGTRQATVMFPVGTTASLVLPSGAQQPISSLSVRATEYTVGPNGPKAMPGPLPPNSGYTYAVELSADEAIAANAREVRFSQPLALYFENFLSFPVGSAVPIGYLDRTEGAWLPSQNGRVVKIVAISAPDGASVDTDGNGTGDNLGISADERVQLGALYGVGQTLWRAPIDHFTPWDCNYPYGPPNDSRDPNQRDPDCDQPEEEPNECPGSILDCENQSLGEEIAIVGTPFKLSYSSRWSAGRRAAYTLKIPLTDDTIPTSLLSVKLEISVAGRQFETSFSPAPNLETSFTWDGKDRFGRVVFGQQSATVRIGYEYPAVYYPSANAFADAFARFPPNDWSQPRSRTRYNHPLAEPQRDGPWHARHVRPRPRGLDARCDAGVRLWQSVPL